MTPYIIASITTLAFIAMGIYLATSARKLRYPVGLAIDRVIEDVRVRFIFSSPTLATPSALRHSTYAIMAVAHAWKTYTGGEEMYDTVDELVVHYAQELGPKLHGFQSYVKGGIGSRRVPLLVIAERHIPNEFGDPVVAHEAGHVLAGLTLGHPDREHKLRAIWDTHVHSPNEVWFELVAREKYAALVKEDATPTVSA